VRSKRDLLDSEYRHLVNHKDSVRSVNDNMVAVKFYSVKRERFNV